jgi:hypothetical protein
MRFAGDDCADDSDGTVGANRSGGEYGSDGDRHGSKRIRRRTGVISSTLFAEKKIYNKNEIIKKI